MAHPPDTASTHATLHETALRTDPVHARVSSVCSGERRDSRSHVTDSVNTSRDNDLYSLTKSRQLLSGSLWVQRPTVLRVDRGNLGQGTANSLKQPSPDDKRRGQTRESRRETLSFTRQAHDDAALGRVETIARRRAHAALHAVSAACARQPRWFLLATP